MKMKELFSKKTKIVCTIGPASDSQAVLKEMIRQGMDIARINFAHGDLDQHRETIANVRAAAEATGRRVAIFGDLPGPKMRIGELASEPIQLEKGHSFELVTGEVVGNREVASINFKELPEVVKAGDSIFLNDGYVHLAVDQVTHDAIHCTVFSGGELWSHKGVNVPDIDLGISAFTPADSEFLKFAAEQHLDGVSQSFVENERDIEEVRRAAHDLNYDPFIIAKIERSRALGNLEKILEAADAIMVARGDLGVEIPIEKIAATQKKIIHLANLKGKPVITATQMLESMIDHTRPTRAEATDVANAILDGTDCVMLSGETAVGHLPVDTVTVMASIARETEENGESMGASVLLAVQQAKEDIARSELVALNIYHVADTMEPTVIFVPCASGNTARDIARFRLPQWIVSICLDEQTCQKLQFSYGIYPVFIEKNPSSWPRYAQKWLQQHGIDGDLVIVVEGTGVVREGDTIRLNIIDLA